MKNCKLICPFRTDGICKRRTEFLCNMPLSYSSMSTFMRCKRMFYFSKVCELRTKRVGTALQLGTFASDVLDDIHTGKAIDGRIREVLSQKGKPYENNVLAGQIKACAMFSKYRNETKLRGQTQYKWNVEINGVPIKGYIDLLTDKSVYEFKYTSFPENYNSFTVFDQLALYCLATKRKKGVIRCFDKSVGARALKIDNVETYRKRCEDYMNKTKRPLYTDTALYSSDLTDERFEALKTRITMIHNHLLTFLNDYKEYGKDAFYEERHACFNPYKCDYYSICETGIISETLYESQRVDKEVTQDAL